ncbi:MAG: hypothetical protein KBD12_01995 [Candidatus Pacebacteria bacterium]|nr:hypothetical protein [Candidatus Paceibacterota bacterium]
MKINKIKSNIFLLFLTVVFVTVNFFALAAISTDMNSAGPIDFKSTSSNYQFDAEVGAPAVGQSLSNGFIFDHGAFWGDVTGTVGKIHWLVQELRNYTSGSNDKMIFFLKFKQNGNLIYTTSLITSDIDGTYDAGIDLSNLPAGTYDIYVKGFQTLTKKYSNVNIVNGENILNFTQTDPSNLTKGSINLTVGDIDGAGTSTASLGDDLVNSLDVTLVLGQNSNTGTFLRTDINQDTLVNSLDTTAVLLNINKVGDN